MSMYRCRIEKVAREIATEKSASYGMSVFDGAWYVGTAEELRKIGVVDVFPKLES
jgi:hypothetical protein